MNTENLWEVTIGVSMLTHQLTIPREGANALRCPLLSPWPSGGLVSICVPQVRSDMENRMAQAQAVAVREALKETNVQTSSKEVS